MMIAKEAEPTLQIANTSDSPLCVGDNLCVEEGEGARCDLRSLGLVPWSIEKVLMLRG